MKVETHARPMKFGDVLPGTFFKFMGKEFGLSIVDIEGTRRSLIFNSSRTGIWKQDPNRDVIAFPEAIVRPDFGSIAAHVVSAQIGALISTVNGFYVRGIQEKQDESHMTIDISNGSAFALSDTESPMIVYSRWEVGHEEGDKFKPIFEFPVVTSSKA
jgi:hypothetical protein